MWAGMLLGWMLWNIRFLAVCCILALDEVRTDLWVRTSLIWMLVFAFIGAIIGEIFQWHITFLTLQI